MITKEIAKLTQEVLVEYELDAGGNVSEDVEDKEEDEAGHQALVHQAHAEAGKGSPWGEGNILPYINWLKVNM